MSGFNVGVGVKVPVGVRVKVAVAVSVAVGCRVSEGTGVPVAAAVEITGPGWGAWLHAETIIKTAIQTSKYFFVMGIEFIICQTLFY